MLVFFRLRSVLDTRIARLVAAAMITLVLTPCTAPFSTFDVAEIASEHPLHADSSPLNVVQDITDLAFLSTGTSPFTLTVRFDSTPAADLIDTRSIALLVLRI